MIRPLLLLLFAFSLTCCMDDDDIDPGCDGFGEGDTITLPNGSDLLIADISDQVCPCDAVCIWAGQYVVTVQTGPDAGDLDTLYLPAGPLNAFDTLSLYGFPVTEFDPNLVNYCGGEVPEDELCFTIRF